MAYTVHNFKTKKALREAVTAWLAAQEKAPDPMTIAGIRHQVNAGGVEVYQPGPFGPKVKDGMNVIEGPHGVHKWYARVVVKDGIITKFVG